MKIDVSSLSDMTQIVLEGRLDTTTAPELEDKLKEILDSVTNLEFDMTKLDYISSAGLRVLLGAHKAISKVGKMVIKNVNPNIMEVFEVTGFIDILNIE